MAGTETSGGGLAPNKESHLLKRGKCSSLESSQWQAFFLDWFTTTGLESSYDRSTMAHRHHDYDYEEMEDDVPFDEAPLSKVKQTTLKQPSKPSFATKASMQAIHASRVQILEGKHPAKTLFSVQHPWNYPDDEKQTLDIPLPSFLNYPWQTDQQNASTVTQEAVTKTKPTTVTPQKTESERICPWYKPSCWLQDAS